jgi:hypothetical protein
VASARIIDEKYPGCTFKVVVHECPLCGVPIEKDYDERFHTAEHLEWMGESDLCADCERVRDTAPAVFAMIERLVQYRLSKLGTP